MQSSSTSGSIVDAAVTKHIGLGAICSVGQARAIVRNNEIDWDPRRQNHATIPEGSTFRAVVIGQDEQGQLIISRKAAAPAPFQKFVGAHEIGDLVDAVVEHKTPSAWVVRLGGGLAGRLPTAEVPALPAYSGDLTEQPELKPGDHLRVQVLTIDQVKKKITVSLKRAVRQIETTEWAELLKVGRERASTQYTWTRRVKSCRIPKTRDESSLKVLLVDDREDLLYSLSSLLSDRAHHVAACSSVVQARSYIDEANRIDVAVVDLQLSGQQISQRVFQRLRERFPNSRKIVFTADPVSGPTFSQEHGCLLVQKPIAPDDLIAIIEGRKTPELLSENIEQAFDDLAQLASVSSAEYDAVEKLLDDHLSAMSEAAPGAYLAVLRHARSTNEVICLRSYGIDRKPFKEYSTKLRFSFVGDVLAKRDFGQFTINPWRTISDSLTKLMQKLGANRVIGVRVPANSMGDSLAAFAFLPNSAESLEQSQTRAFQQQARALGLEIDRAVLDAGITRRQRALTAGSLVLGMTHELKNAVSTLLFQAKHLTEALEAEQKSPGTRLRDCIECHTRMNRQIEDLETVFESLLGMTSATTGDDRPIEELLLDTVRQCQPTADQANIALWLDSRISPQLTTYGVPGILGQVVMNLILNGIQHTRAMRRQNGFVLVTLNDEMDASGRWLCIRVRDNAFGIDTVQFHSIFRMFETSRRNGSGLGLYVSRMISNALHGDIEVECSHKFLGSTLLVRLPVQG